MPPKATQVTGNHAQAAVTTPSSLQFDLPASKKRAAASVESPRVSKQRRVNRVDARAGPPCNSPDSSPATRKSGRTKPAAAQLEPSLEVEEDEEVLPARKKEGGNRVSTGVVVQEIEITASPKRTKKTTTTIVKEKEEAEVVEPPRRSRKSKKTETAVVVKEEDTEIAESPKRSRKAKKIEAAAVLKEEEVEAADDVPKKVKRHRKTKEEKEAEAMPLAARTNGLRMFIGAHVSSAKGELAAEWSKQIRATLSWVEANGVLLTRCTKLSDQCCSYRVIFPSSSTN